MGVATALSTVTASAPSYVAETSTTGGVILGYSSIERLKIEIAPNNTITIESTIANIGRETKNFSIRLSYFNRNNSLATSGTLYAVDEYHLARTKPLAHDP